MVYALSGVLKSRNAANEFEQNFYLPMKIVSTLYMYVVINIIAPGKVEF